MHIAEQVEQISVCDYLKRKRWQHKMVGNQFCLQECTFCGDTKWHFYIRADNGTWCCHKCQAKGSFYQLKKYDGDNGMIRSAGQIINKQAKAEPLDVKLTDMKLDIRGCFHGKESSRLHRTYKRTQHNPQ